MSCSEMSATGACQHVKNATAARHVAETCRVAVVLPRADVMLACSLVSPHVTGASSRMSVPTPFREVGLEEALGGDTEERERQAIDGQSRRSTGDSDSFAARPRLQ